MVWSFGVSCPGCVLSQPLAPPSLPALGQGVLGRQPWCGTSTLPATMWAAVGKGILIPARPTAWVSWVVSCETTSSDVLMCPCWKRQKGTRISLKFWLAGMYNITLWCTNSQHWYEQLYFFRGISMWAVCTPPVCKWEYFYLEAFLQT